MNNTPLYAKVAAIVGRPVVLVAALLMGAPSEIRLAQTAGFGGFTAYLAPFVLSVYAGCAAVVASTRKKGDRGWLSSILGAGLALGFALSAQVTAHLLAAGHISSGPWLITAVSSVPSIACAHLLHLAVMPKTPAVGVTHDDSVGEGPNSDENDTEAQGPDECLVSPPKGRSKARKPSLEVIRNAAKAIESTGKRVSGPALAAALGVSDRSGYRYVKTLAA